MPTLAELQPLIRARARLASAASDGRVPVDDLVQIGMLAAHAVLQRPGTRAEDHIRARALLAARGRMVDAVRIETRHRRHPDQGRAYRTEPLSVAALRKADPAPGPEEIAIRRQMARQVADAINELPEQQQAALRLDLEEPGARAELAALWGVDPSRVSQIRNKAIKALQARFNPVPARQPATA